METRENGKLLNVQHVNLVSIFHGNKGKFIYIIYLLLLGFHQQFGKKRKKEKYYASFE